MLDPDTLIIVAATFLLAGAVKGVIGLGLPSVSLGILTAAIDLPTAMALLLAPSFVTNLWQGVVGGKLREILVRTWPFLLAATVTIPIGALALSSGQAATTATGSPNRPNRTRVTCDLRETINGRF